MPYEDDLVYLVDSSVLYIDYPDTSSSEDLVVSTGSTVYYVVDTSLYGVTVIYIDQYGYLVDPYLIVAYPTNYLVVETQSIPSGTIFVDTNGVLLYPQPEVVYVYSYSTVSVQTISE